jgi:hypothetical protein
MANPKIQTSNSTTNRVRKTIAGTLLNVDVQVARPNLERSRPYAVVQQGGTLSRDIAEQQVHWFDAAEMRLID